MPSGNPSHFGSCIAATVLCVDGMFVFFGAAAQVEADLEEVGFEDDELAELVDLEEDEVILLGAVTMGALILVLLVLTADEDFVTNEVFVVTVSIYTYAAWTAVNVSWPGIKAVLES
jgi:hypothetical protein